MAHTHTFELNVNSLDIEGEITFDGASAPQVKIDSIMDIPIAEFDAINSFFKHLVGLYHKCNKEITKISIEKKP